MISTAISGHRLIILGCGYVGRAAATAARDSGWVVEALTRHQATAQSLRDDLGIRAVVGDLASDTWHQSLDPAGATVLNCVSSGGGGETGYAHAYRDGMRSLVRWVQQGRPQTVIYTSSTSVYPDADGGWVDEDALTRATTPLNGLLMETEGLLREAVEAGTLTSATVLRLAGIYGPGRHYLIDQVRSRVAVLPGRGDYHLNLVHRDDVASAVRCAAERPVPGFRFFNIADGRPALKEAIVRWTAEQLGVPVPVFDPENIPARQARRALFGERPPDRRIASTRAQEVLGWKPTYADFRAGYRTILGSTGSR